MAPNAVAASQPSNGTVGSAISMSATGPGVTRTAAPAIVHPQSASSVGNVAVSNQVPTVSNQVPTVATAQVMTPGCLCRYPPNFLPLTVLDAVKRALYLSLDPSCYWRRRNDGFITCGSVIGSRIDATARATSRCDRHLRSSTSLCGREQCK